ncbi:MAG: hypothetical protein HYX68_00505 [Planctomycetes bacterium]|jgi:hypothetical protein|nr:hypothetical protein [Planctomycetota bacterium]
MDDTLTTKRLVGLRKLTRSITEHVRSQLKEYLTTLAPLLRQRAVLGEYVKSDVKESVKGGEAAFKEMQALYAKVAAVKPFSLSELRSPVETQGSSLEFHAVEYVHAAKTETDTKSITVVSPLKWSLSYAGFGPKRLRELLADRNRSGAELETAVQHCLMLHTVLTRQPAVVKLLEALRFTMTIDKAEGLGELPIVIVSSVIPTLRPADDLIIESTEISGTDSFEEVVSVGEIANLRDPFRAKLVELAKAAGEAMS